MKFSRDLLRAGSVDELNRLRREIAGQDVEEFGNTAYSAEVLQIVCDLVDLSGAAVESPAKKADSSSSEDDLRR